MAFDHPQTGVHRFLFVEAWLRVRGQQRGLARVPSVTKQVAIKLSHYCAVYFECADRERESQGIDICTKLYLPYANTLLRVHSDTVSRQTVLLYCVVIGSAFDPKLYMVLTNSSTSNYSLYDFSLFM